MTSPADILKELERSRLRYSRLLDEHGGDIVRAGYELATIKRAACSHCHCGEALPNAREVWTAALEIQSKTTTMIPVPSKHAILSICRSANLEVLE